MKRGRRWLILVVGAVVAACTASPSPTSPLSSNSGPTPTVRIVPIETPTPAPSIPGLSTPIPVTGTAASVAFWTATHGLVVGSGSDGKGEVWSTTDGGQTWAAIRPGLPPLRTVAVADGGHAWAMGSCSQTGPAIACSIFASADAGHTWMKISDESLGALSFSDASDGWSVFDDGPAPGGPVGTGTWRTTDGGHRWVELKTAPCATIGGPVAVSFVSASHGWVGCQLVYGAGSADKGIVETTDAGATWQVRSAVGFDKPSIGSISESDYLAGLSMRPSGFGFAWEERGGTMRTLDGGRTWSGIPPGGTDAGPVPVGATTPTDGDWFVVMWDGNLQATALWASHDSGVHWSSVSAVPPLR